MHIQVVRISVVVAEMIRPSKSKLSFAWLRNVCIDTQNTHSKLNSLMLVVVVVMMVMMMMMMAVVVMVVPLPLLIRVVVMVTMVMVAMVMVVPLPLLMRVVMVVVVVVMMMVMVAFSPLIFPRHTPHPFSTSIYCLILPLPLQLLLTLLQFLQQLLPHVHDLTFSPFPIFLRAGSRVDAAARCAGTGSRGRVCVAVTLTGALTVATLNVHQLVLLAQVIQLKLQDTLSLGGLERGEYVIHDMHVYMYVKQHPAKLWGGGAPTSE